MAVDPAWAQGAAYVDGRICPVAEAAVPALDWGYRRSDVCYDVVGVWQGAFFRLDDHLERFARSRAELRMAIRESDAEIRAILHELVRRSGLRSAYVAMDCLRGRPGPGLPRHPSSCRPWLLAMAIPWVWVIPEEVQARGAHLIVARTLRIDDGAVDPTVKNFHWGDLTRALFEAEDAGADNAILLDRDGFVTEGPGFNVCAVIGRTVVTPDRGALEGITRRSVGELCAEMGLDFAIRPLPAAELREADEVFLATTAGGIMPVARVDRRIYGNDRPGPVGSALRERFWAKRAEGWHATPVEYGEAA